MEGSAESQLFLREIGLLASAAEVRAEDLGDDDAGRHRAALFDPSI